MCIIMCIINMIELNIYILYIIIYISEFLILNLMCIINMIELNIYIIYYNIHIRIFLYRLIFIKINYNLFFMITRYFLYVIHYLEK